MTGGKKGNTGNKREREQNTPSPEQNPNRPTKKVNMGGKSNDELFAAITDMSQGLSLRMGIMEKDLKDTVKTLTESLELKFQKWEEEKADLICKQRDLEKRLNELERRERKNNALITGLEATRDNVKVVVNNTLAKLAQPVTVEEARVLNVQGGATKIFVRFRSFEDKMSVFNQKKGLTGLVNKTPVFINDDLTRREQEIQYHGRMFAKTMRSQNKNVRMGYGRIWVDGECWIWDDDTKAYVNRKN